MSESLLSGAAGADRARYSVRRLLSKRAHTIRKPKYSVMLPAMCLREYVAQSSFIEHMYT